MSSVNDSDVRSAAAEDGPHDPPRRPESGPYAEPFTAPSGEPAPPAGSAPVEDGTEPAERPAPRRAGALPSSRVARRSACGAMVSEGFGPTGPGIAAPSAM